MLKKAEADGKKIVSPALFAIAGASFTKKAFIVAMYEGMYQGIKQHIDEKGAIGPSSRIVLNNWTPPGI